MREILFRGKSESNCEWVYGNPIYDNVSGKHYIVPFGNITESDKVGQEGCTYCVGFEVIPETVGQYTGKNDKNGKKIFEGDIVKVHQFLFDGSEYENEITLSIEYMSDCTCFGANIIDGRKIKHYMGYTGEKVVIPLCDLYGLHEESFEVIGNIHDNKMEDFINGN